MIRRPKKRHEYRQSRQPAKRKHEHSELGQKRQTRQYTQRRRHEQPHRHREQPRRREQHQHQHQHQQPHHRRQQHHQPHHQQPHHQQRNGQHHHQQHNDQHHQYQRNGQHHQQQRNDQHHQPNFNKELVAGLSNTLEQLIQALSTPPPEVKPSFSNSYLNTQHPENVHALYGALGFQCSTCGLRHKTRELRDKHLDWHFSHNKRMLTRSQQSVHRNWSISLQEWVEYDIDVVASAPPKTQAQEKAIDVAKAAEEAEARVVMVDGEDTVCSGCHEELKSTWCDIKDSWVYKQAIQITDTPVLSPHADEIKISSLVTTDREQKYKIDTMFAGQVMHFACYSSMFATIPPSPQEELPYI